jgi:predicted RNA-binding protein with PUA-like domain
MSTIHRWWDGFAGERYWLEVTDRQDLGVNLKAPVANESGQNYWSYSLIREVAAGDTVFHYDKNAQAITAKTVATGKPWSDVITWAARGTYARHAGIQPHARAGFYLGLEQYSTLENPVTLAQLRAKSNKIRKGLRELEEAVSPPLYYPFEISEKRESRPLQGYLFKLPAFFVGLFTELSHPPTDSAEGTRDLQSLGVEYRRPQEDQAVAERDPFAVDPSLVERGIRGHVATQNQLAEAVVNAGMSPRSPSPLEPNFDLAWSNGSTVWVAEVKSLTIKNEEKQLRLGLGQILRYAHLLARLHSMTVRPILVAERKPSSADWSGLCASHNVQLLWPPFLLLAVLP